MGIVVLARFWTRQFVSRDVGLDDYFMIAAMVYTPFPCIGRNKLISSIAVHCGKPSWFLFGYAHGPPFELHVF